MLQTLILFLAFGISFLITLPAGAQSIGTAASGVDWESDASFIRVTEFTPAHIDHLANFSCFGETSAPAQSNLAAMANANETTSNNTLERTILSDLNECFQQAGIYEVSVQLADLAGNTRQEDYTFEIKSDIPVSSQTQIAPTVAQKANDNQNLGAPFPVNDCLAEGLIANNQDNCQVQIIFKDKFENVFMPENGRNIEIEIVGKNDNITDLDLMSFPVDNFINGVSLTPSILDSSQANADKSFNLALKSLAPSLEILTSNLNPLFKLSRNTNYPVSINFKYPNVDRDGSQQSSQGEFNQALALDFLPWVRIRFSNQAPINEQFTAPDSEISMPSGEVAQFYAFADTFTNNLLPEYFVSKIRGFTSSNTDLDNEDLDDPAGKDLIYTTVTQASDYKPFTTTGIQNGYIPGEKISLSSEVSLTLYQGQTPYQITYPAGGISTNVGDSDAFDDQDLTDINGDTDTDLSLVNLGVDIEGIALSNNSSNPLDHFNFDASSDIREDLIKNVYTAIRGISGQEKTEFNLNQDFGTDDIVYIKNSNLKLTGDGQQLNPIVFNQGVKTLVIENGNILIDRDISYPQSNTENHLAIVLINNSQAARGVGNIFVNAEVQNLSGTIYADGSLLSTLQTSVDQITISEAITDRINTNESTPVGPLSKQLILHGTIFSRNTIGGSQAANPINPWQENVSLAEARKYDLNYMRRYIQPFSVGLPIPDDQNNFCVKKSNICDNNPFSFVIRTNQLNNYLPAPGFKNYGKIGR